MKKFFTFFLALAASVGMSFATTNSITINESSHGSVVASSSSAAAGETITLTATPDDGYQLKSISGVYVPRYETLNFVAAKTTVTGTKFQCVGTMNANNYGWRVFNTGTDSTLTVSSKDGATLIEKIEFTSTWGKQRTNDMLSVSAGTLSFDGSDPSTTVTINDINATSVTISGSGNNAAKTWCIASVKVYYEGTEEVELEISDTENANVKTFTMVDSEVTISAEFEPAPVVNLKLIEFQVPASWENDNTPISIADFPDFVATTYEIASALPVTSEPALVVFDFPGDDENSVYSKMGGQVSQPSTGTMLHEDFFEHQNQVHYYYPVLAGGEPTPTVWTSLAVGDVIKLGDKIEVPAEGDGWGINGNILRNAWGPYTLIRANIVQEHEYDDPEVTEAEDGAYYVFKAENDDFYPLSNLGKGTGLVVTGTSDGLVVTDVGDLGMPVFTVAVHDNGSATAIDNANANAKAVKVIRNGQLLIERDGKTYTIIGTMIQ